MKREDAIQYMKDHMTNNKAMGLLAQAEFERWARGETSVEPKYFDGCWIASPKGFTASRRVCFFIHPKLEDENSVDAIVENIVSQRKYHTVFGSISRAGLGVTYCLPVGDEDTNFSDLQWQMFRYNNETLEKLDPFLFFSAWPGSRGRASRGKPWKDPVNERYETLDMDLLEPLVLNQVFYNSFVKGVFKKPLSDPYDTDAFIVSYEGKIFPLEIKEKFPFTSGNQKMFGIDAGRILMLLRICLPLDCNGLYVIREVQEGNRDFIGWKMMTLDNVIMNSNWNLQAGGTGMLGGMTQTVTLPYRSFSDLKVGTISDDNLHEMSKFSEGVKRKAANFLHDVENLFHKTEQQRTLG